MPAIKVHAIGKSILFGEHAVVYGYPAIAVPVSSLHTKAVITPDIRAVRGSYFLQAPDIHYTGSFEDIPQPNIFMRAVQIFKDVYHLDNIPSFRLNISSQIPVASGLGSSASVAVALTRAISQYLGLKLSEAKINSFAFDLEKVTHGNPSGIDNTVITYAKTLYFIRDALPLFLQTQHPLHIVLMDSGIHSLTSEVVADIKAARQHSPKRMDTIFEQIGKLTDQAKDILSSGSQEELGELMNENHILLQRMGVSTPELNRLVDFALKNHALGAKLCGAGRGGNVIALLNEETIPSFTEALVNQGIKNYYLTTIE